MRPKTRKKYKPRRHACLMCGEDRRCYSSELALLNHIANDHLRQEGEHGQFRQFSVFCFCGARWTVPSYDMHRRTKKVKVSPWSELTRHFRDAGGFEQHYLAYRLGLSSA